MHVAEAWGTATLLPRGSYGSRSRSKPWGLQLAGLTPYLGTLATRAPLSQPPNQSVNCA